MDKRLQGKVALVTGAASGIGLACCERFAREGATVIGVDRNAVQDWRGVSEVAAAASFKQLDVTDLAALQEVVATSVKDFGRLDILLTSAGVADAGPVHLVDEEAWDQVLNVNLKGTFLSIKAALPPMMEQRSGCIITIASVEGQMGSEGGSSYNASKGGVVLLSKNVAMDYGKMGIRCNAICPGFIDTPLLRSVMDMEGLADYKIDVIKQHKLGRLGRPEEIAGAAFFLASDDASFVTGQALAVDGGYSAGHSHGLVELMGLS